MVPSTSNKISAVGGSAITYNSAGSILTSSGGTNAYSWNAAGQMATASVSGSTVGTYTYDSQNRRTKKVAGGNTTQYVYGLNGLLYGEYTNAGVLIREYVYLDDQPLAQIDAGSPEVPTYLHPDHLGKPIYGTNSGGTQVWAANSDAFGVGTPSGSRTVNIRMPGQYYDSESGLFYNGNRYYNPATGRYISSDPIGIDGGLNTFLYAEASPVMYTDPEGLAVIPAGWVLWNSVLVPVSICVATPGCRDQAIGAIQNATVPITQGITSAIKWCLQPTGSILNNESTEGDANREKNCQALKQSILSTCASLFGKKKFQCFAAADKSYRQCMED